MVHVHSPIRSEVSAFDKSLCSGTHLSMTGVTLTPSGMVMLLIPRVTVTPLSDGKDTLEKCYSTLRKVAIRGAR